MYTGPLFTIVVILHIQDVRLSAQANDSVYAGRHCNNRLKALHMPRLAEIGDSASLDSLLTNAADSQAHITVAEFQYNKDGAVVGVDVTGARSKAARDRLSQDARAALKLQKLPAGPFTLELVRLNRTRQLRLLVGTATCAPQAHETPKLHSQIYFFRKAYPGRSTQLTVYVAFILEANGRVSDAWLRPPTGVARLDSLTKPFSF